MKEKTMRLLKERIVLLLLLGIFIGGAVCLLKCSPYSGTSGRFLFLLYSLDRNGKVIPVTSSRITREQLDGGLKIYYQPLENAYLYLVLMGPGERPRILYPPEGGEPFSGNYHYKEFFFPPRDFFDSYLDAPGEYELYLLTASRRLEGLEKLIKQYRKKENLGSVDRLLAELRRLKRETLWPRNLEETPVRHGGTIRDSEELFSLVRTVPFRDLYIATYYFDYAGPVDEKI